MRTKGNGLTGMTIKQTTAFRLITTLLLILINAGNAVAAATYTWTDGAGANNWVASGSWTPPGIVTETGAGNPVDVEITNTHTNQPAANYRLRVE